MKMSGKFHAPAALFLGK